MLYIYIFVIYGLYVRLCINIDLHPAAPKHMLRWGTPEHPEQLPPFLQPMREALCWLMIATSYGGYGGFKHHNMTVEVI